MDKLTTTQLFFASISGSFIGYLLFHIVNGLCNNAFYKMGLKIGEWLADILNGWHR